MENPAYASRLEGTPASCTQMHLTVRQSKHDTTELLEMKLGPHDRVIACIKTDPGMFVTQEFVGTTANEIGTPRTVHTTGLGKLVGSVVSRELHGGGVYCGWDTIHATLNNLKRANAVQLEMKTGDAAVMDPGAVWECTAGSGVLRGGLGIFFLLLRPGGEWELFGRSDLLVESKLADVAGMWHGDARPDGETREPASMSAAEKVALESSDANLAAKMQSREDAEGAIAIAAAEAAVASDADAALAERLCEQLDAADASAERDSAGDVTMTADDLGGGVTRENGADRGAASGSNPTPASGGGRRSSGTVGPPEPQPPADARATGGGGSSCRRSPRVAASSVLHIDGAAAAILRGSTTAWAALNVQARHDKQKLVVSTHPVRNLVVRFVASAPPVPTVLEDEELLLEGFTAVTMSRPGREFNCPLGRRFRSRPKALLEVSFIAWLARIHQ